MTRSRKARENRPADSPSVSLPAGLPVASSAHPALLPLLLLLVTSITLLAHWPVLSAQAVSFDDEETIIRNHLLTNPSWNSVRQFFAEVTRSSVVPGYYRPLTLTSLMLDWAMGGRPEDFRAFHRTSLALHAGSAGLIALLVFQVFHRPIPALVAGLLFGVHPMSVEPVAWVMERKTLLAGFFAFAALNAYVRYTRCSRRGWYAASLLMYLLSLLSKPTSTPLPILMLLMDVWPLSRVRRGRMAFKPGPARSNNAHRRRTEA
jgi:protein O-mannosyl-transferase